MTLQEYFDQFLKEVDVDPRYGVLTQVAAEIAAGYEAGLSLEQMHRFLARRTQITSVAVALKSPTLRVEAIERILEARRHGAVDPKEVLVHAFAPEEIHEKFRPDVFGPKGA